VDSTGLKLGGAGEWLVEKHGTSRRRSWRKLHIGIDGESGEIVAIELTKKESDDAARTDALLDQLPDPLASFTRTIRTEFTRLSPSVIRMPLSSCRREEPQFRARPPRPLRHNGTGPAPRGSGAFPHPTGKSS
jgi:hypothetical protein